MPSARLTLTLLCLAILAALIGGALWQEGRIDAAQAQAAQMKGERDQARGETELAKRAAELAGKQIRVVTKYVDRVQVVREAAQVITKEIPIYVTQKADAACPIPAGFVQLHNAAAAGTAPDAANAGDPDAPAPGVTLSAITETVSTNYATYHTLSAQVVGLQDEVGLLHDYIRTSCAAR